METAEQWRLEYRKQQLEPKRTLIFRDDSFVKAVQLDAWKQGVADAYSLIQKKADNYDAENGSTDPETGVREYPKGGEEYMIELTELIEELAELRNTKNQI